MYEDPQEVINSRLELQVEGLELRSSVHWNFEIVFSDSLLNLHYFFGSLKLSHVILPTIHLCILMSLGMYLRGI